MNAKLAPPKRPCGSCPYRRDVPSGIWDPSEYAKLPAYDAETWAQPIKLFMCHQQDGCLCGGWIAAHGAESLLALRIAAPHLAPETFDYTPGVPVFGSGAEAAAHGMAQVASPPPEAIRKMAGLVRQQRKRSKGEAP